MNAHALWTRFFLQASFGISETLGIVRLTKNRQIGQKDYAQTVSSDAREKREWRGDRDADAESDQEQPGVIGGGKKMRVIWSGLR